MKRAAVYLRVSTEEQVKHGFSLAEQRQACFDKAALYEPDEIIEFADEGISGELLDRPGLSALRKELRAGRISVVICRDPDRLSRNLAHQLLLVEEIEKSGAVLDFVDFTWQNTPDGRLFYSLRGAIAEYEKEKIRERTARGKLQKAKLGGLPVYAASYGYIYENGRLRPHPVESEVVKLIYRWFTTEDIGINGIAARLNKEGVPTRKGGARWQRCVVRTILTNPTYVGTFYYNRRDCKGKGYNKHLPPEKRNQPVLRPKEEWIPIPVPAIIDRETWDKAQEKIKEARRLWSGWTKHNYLLSGIISCADCGNTMHGAFNKRRIYTCVKTPAEAPNRGCSPIKTVSADKVESTVWKQVCTWLNEPEMLIKELHDQGKEKEIRADLERIEKHLADVEKGRDNIRQALAAGLLDLDAKTVNTLNDLKKRHRQLTDRKRELEAALRKSASAVAKIKELRKQVSEFLSQLDSLNFEQKKTLVRLLVKQVLISGRGDNLHITIHAGFVPEVDSSKLEKLF